MSLLLAELAAGLGGAGQVAEGLGVVDRALARAEQTEAGWYLAELLRTKGELRLLEGVPSAAANAEACFQQALDVARRQNALSWELRAATSLARLLRGQQPGPRRASCWGLSTAASPRGSKRPISSPQKLFSPQFVDR